METEHTRAELHRLLQAAVAGLPPDTQYAIGGAVAMAELGYRRETQDINVFVLAEHLNAFMRALSAAGLQTYAIQEPSHYAAKLRGDPDPERRLDMQVPYGEPEFSAVEYAYTGKDGLRYMGGDLLAMVKFYAYDDSRDYRHAGDLAAMYRRGLFVPGEVRAMIEAVDPERLEKYNAVIQAILEVGAGQRKRRPQKRLPPPEGGNP